MLKTRTSYLALGLAAAVFSFNGYAAEAPTLNTDLEKASYAIGLKYGESMKRDLSELDVNLIIRGLSDGFNAKKPLLTEVETAQALTAFQQKKRAEMEKERAETADANRTKGEAFLAENAQKVGVEVTDSGLQYKILKAGKGDSPGPNDTVTVHYEGTLVDGTVFDSSRQRGQPIQFSVNGVIPGWTEALQLMKPGAHWQLFIPSNLAYGEKGASSVIGPNETLIFDVELIKIAQQEKTANSPHAIHGMAAEHDKKPH
ncbi:MAG: FKBP-type peptidyl-prolyl cis-trans isomerase [Gammaproteobacteria bacterium]